MKTNRLQKYCNVSIEHLRKIGKFTPCTRDGAGYTFIDRGSNVLAVAHIDTVQQGTNFKVTGLNGGAVYSPRLDDRLGAYTIIEYLPSVGVKMDVLLCEDEETMQSTAAYFQTLKKYNWMVEFDRGGRDTVLYQYHYDKTFSDELERHGFILGHGTYSDIADLGHLGCLGVNCSAGYYNYHTKDAFVLVEVWQKSVDSFVSFYNDNKDTYYPHDKTNDYYNESSLWDRDDYYYGTGKYGTTYYGNKKNNRALVNVEWTKCPTCEEVRTDRADRNLIDYFGMCSECLIYVDRYQQKYNKNPNPPTTQGG
jgi:hypothetical protein